MTAVKSCTDIEQSRKLAEILSLESADMMYHSVEDEYGSGAFVTTSKAITNGLENDDFYIDDIPCWSLAALIKVLPSIEGFKPVIDLDINQIRYEGKYRDELCFDSENLIDACYEMIIKLHEQNLL
jgi:hypothetical protein